MVKCLLKKTKNVKWALKGYIYNGYAFWAKLLFICEPIASFCVCVCVCVCVCARARVRGVVDGWLALLDLLKSSLEYGKLATAQTKKDGYPYIFIVTKK